MEGCLGGFGGKEGVMRVVESVGKRSILDSPNVFLRVIVDAESREIRW